MSGMTCAEKVSAGSEWPQQRELQQVLGRLLPEESFAQLSRHGNAEWTPHVLTTVAVVWAWQSLGGLVVRFEASRRVLAQLIPGAVLPRTYQAFVKALATHSEELIQVVLVNLRQRMQQGGGEFWTVGRWCVFAVDGTRLRTPRTAENQTWFDQPMPMAGRRRRTSRKTQRGRPQAWLTVCWHVGWGLPWAFRHGFEWSSETHHAGRIERDASCPRHVGRTATRLAGDGRCGLHR